MLQLREKAEGHMIWQINSGAYKSFGGNWTSKGQLAYLVPEGTTSSKLSVKEFILDRKWNLAKSNLFILDNIISHISDIEIGNLVRDDQVFGDLRNGGKYSTKTASHLVRTNRPKQPLRNGGKYSCLVDIWILNVTVA